MGIKTKLCEGTVSIGKEDFKTNCIGEQKDLYDNYGEPSIVNVVKQNRLRWLGHLIRMSEDRIPKQELTQAPRGTNCKGRPRRAWLQCIQEDLDQLEVRDWKDLAKQRKEWK